MAFKAVQKVVVNGSSAMVTIPRPLLFALGLRPGQFVELFDNEDGSMTIRPWRDATFSGRNSPGQIAAEAPVVK